MRVEVGHAEWERQPGEAVNTSENNGFDVGGSVELSFEASGIGMLEVCGTGEYWFGRSDYSDNPSKNAATELPIVSLCTEIDMARDQDDGQPRAESRKVGTSRS